MRKYKKRGNGTACKRWFSFLVPGIKTTLSGLAANTPFHWGIQLAPVTWFYSKMFLNICIHVFWGYMSKMNTGPKRPPAHEKVVFWEHQYFTQPLFLFYFIFYFIMSSKFYIVVEPRVSYILGKHCTNDILPHLYKRAFERLGFLKYLLLRKFHYQIWISRGTKVPTIFATWF